MASMYVLPPIAFLVVLGSVWAQSKGMDWFAPKTTTRDDSGKYAAWACGEDVKDHKSQPEYGEFFHFAFFFTVLHVLALIVATVPRGTIGGAGLAVGMLATASVSLLVLFRR
ncbi:MAG TPA: hypothetical protein VMK12_05675 [Anaeromyxobacteraceae bacterium]|nr:hypothetical protein [Anaeromyxobacteraceae bacterium]